MILMGILTFGMIQREISSEKYSKMKNSKYSTEDVYKKVKLSDGTIRHIHKSRVVEIGN